MTLEPDTELDLLGALHEQSVDEQLTTLRFEFAMQLDRIVAIEEHIDQIRKDLRYVTNWINRDEAE